MLDIGNTRIKAGLFSGPEPADCLYFSSREACIEGLKPLISKIRRAIIGTVVSDIDDLLALLPANTLVFKSDTPIPIKNGYATQQTLGSDRLAAAIGAQGLFPGQNCLVVDAGTCIKYNILSKDNVYLGGAISPGLAMRLRALHTFTDRLPLLEMDADFDTLTGRSTRDSILSGVLNGALAEADGLIDRYRAQFPGLACIVTGGDGPYLAKRLKNHIFAEPYLVLKGLHGVLLYNDRLEK